MMKGSHERVKLLNCLYTENPTHFTLLGVVNRRQYHNFAAFVRQPWKQSHSEASISLKPILPVARLSSLFVQVRSRSSKRGTRRVSRLGHLPSNPEENSNREVPKPSGCCVIWIAESFERMRATTAGRARSTK